MDCTPCVHTTSWNLDILNRYINITRNTFAIEVFDRRRGRDNFRNPRPSTPTFHPLSVREASTLPPTPIGGGWKGGRPTDRSRPPSSIENEERLPRTGRARFRMTMGRRSSNGQPRRDRRYQRGDSAEPKGGRLRVSAIWVANGGSFAPPRPVRTPARGTSNSGEVRRDQNEVGAPPRGRAVFLDADAVRLDEAVHCAREFEFR